MNRRGFLGALLGAAVLDPERLLFVPGKKLISIPAPQLGVSVRYIRAFDIRAGEVISRLDVLYGMWLTHPSDDSVIESEVWNGSDFVWILGAMNTSRSKRDLRTIAVPVDAFDQFRIPSREHRMVMV